MKTFEELCGNAEHNSRPLIKALKEIETETFNGSYYSHSINLINDECYIHYGIVAFYDWYQMDYLVIIGNIDG